MWSQFHLIVSTPRWSEQPSMNWTSIQSLYKHRKLKGKLFSYIVVGPGEVKQHLKNKKCVKSKRQPVSFLVKHSFQYLEASFITIATSHKQVPKSYTHFSNNHTKPLQNTNLTNWKSYNILQKHIYTIGANHTTHCKHIIYPKNWKTLV